MKADPKLVKLIEALIDLREKETLVVDEIVSIMGGGVGIGEQIKEFYGHWSALWLARHRANYTFVFTKDAPNVKRLIKKLGLEDLKARAANYMRCDEDFIVRTKHSFPMFVSTINQHVGVPRTDGPTNCKHAPPCHDDAACTKRTQREVLNAAH